jgi:hypothetical protein
MMLTARLGKLGDATVDAIAQAIYQMEGNGPTTIATRNNNPGNLRSGVGQTGTNGGYAVFPDMATGWAALDNQINLNISRGLTLEEFFAGKPGVYAGYAPSTDSNNPAGYAAFVASQTGIDPNTPLNQISGGSTDSTSCDPTVDPTCGTSDASLFGLDPTTMAIVAGIGLLAIWGFSR